MERNTAEERPAEDDMGVAGGATPASTVASPSAPMLGRAPTVSIGAMTVMDPSLYEPQDPPPSRRDHFADADGDDNINIIEEGEHVSAEDFGLSSAEISMSASINMNVGMELNAIHQIDAFLARPASDVPATRTPRQQPAAVNQEPVQLVDNEHPSSMMVVESEASQAPSATAGTATTPAARLVIASRLDDKVAQLQSHPIVESVATDGRVVLCKCGRSVRLNPPWYILKFEQHIVSRNCTFLRKKKSKRDQASDEKLAIIQAAQVISGQAFGGDLSSGSGVASATPVVNEEHLTDESANASSDPDHDEVSEYKLMTIDELLRMYSPARPTASAASVSREECAKIFNTLQQLKAHVYFNGMTPDGRFLECKCSELIILASPWDLTEFHKHVLTKSNPPKPPRRKSFTGSGGSRKPRLGDGAAFRLEQRLVQRESRWMPVSARVELPCPGLRDERIAAFISATSKVTGGSRARRRIAEELFPHHFTPAARERKPRSKLTPEEKLVLLDAVESEAFWFIDRDANAVRSMDCRGVIAANKGELCCCSCEELQSNASLRVSISVAIGQKRNADSTTDTPATATKISSASKFTLLEQELDMTEEYARLLRDLFRAEVEESSIKNMWFDMAQLGITGCFVSHPAFLGLVESMMSLKEKERRGVGMQNMSYSEHLDSFMKSLSDIKPEACDFFQQRLGGRKQKSLLGKKRKSAEATEPGDEEAPSGINAEGPAGGGVTAVHQLQLAVDSASALTGANDTFPHLLDLSAGGAEHNLAASDMEAMELPGYRHDHPGDSQPQVGEEAAEETEETDAFLTDDNVTGVASAESGGNSSDSMQTHAPRVVLPGFAPCTGLRDENVQAYVKNAVQTIGGSRPKYVIAKELFPEAFDGSRKIKIQEKLTEEQRLIVLDAIFSECLWRVDKVGNCVRSMRCFRRVDKRHGNGVCRSCQELKAVANFRSVLCRAKVPKKVENLKYVPSVYTESDPFMRKLSKNASLRVLYQTVKAMAVEDKKKVTFWLRMAKMGLFGHFRSHVVFEGLVASMVELKDREQRGVGKQNMLYAKSLDGFMTELAALSMEAFELFTHHFCGRTIRSQKVKKRKTSATTETTDPTFQAAMVVNSMAMASAIAPPSTGVSSMASHSASSVATTTAPTSVNESQAIMMPEELLNSTRPISTAELEESQRFMDRMLDEVRMSSEMHLPEEGDKDLDPQTYLDENGVLTTVL